ncbi:hypothetical protein AAMO2058_000258400 [Amorphochlora amoebiformis]
MVDGAAPAIEGGNLALQEREAKSLIYRTVIFCSMTSMLLGYDVGIMAGALPNMTEDLDLSTTEEEIIAGSLNIVAGLCAVVAGYTADKIGRRWALGIACLVFALGAAVMVSAINFGILFVGRIITGIGVGFGLVIAPLYLSEVVPPEKRGFLVCLFDVVLNVGILEGYIVGYIVHSSMSTASGRWRVMIGVAILPPLIIIMGLRYLSESPRWLYYVGRDAQAKEVLLKMIPDQARATQVEEDIKEVIAAEVSNSYKDVLCPETRALKNALHISLGLAIGQQITGSEAVIYYTPEIMKQAGITNLSDQLLWALPVGVAKLAGELISVPLLDNQGRRPMLIIGGSMQAVTLLLLASSFVAKWGFTATIVSVSLFMFFFEVAAPISWLMPSEVYSTGKRGKAQSVAVTVNRIVSGTIAVSFLSLTKSLSVGGTFYLFAALAFFTTVWYYTTVPETMGLTLEEVTQVLAGTKVMKVTNKEGYDNLRNGPELKLEAEPGDELGEEAELNVKVNDVKVNGESRLSSHLVLHEGEH